MLRRVLYITAIFLFLNINLTGQIYDPVSWDFIYERTGDKTYELVFTASVEKGSHIYSMDVPEGGPIPTSFSFNESSGFSLDGKTYEVTKPEELFDEAFGFKIKSFSDKAEFRQKVTSENASFTVTGVVNFMSCNNTTCSPPKDVEFSIKIGENGKIVTSVSENNQVLTAETGKPSGGLLKFFLLSLLAGFAGVLTPCVFPMIPMTVAFFSQGSENRAKSVLKALIFGISIVIIYSMLGIIVSLNQCRCWLCQHTKYSLDSQSAVFCLVCYFRDIIFWCFRDSSAK